MLRKLVSLDAPGGVEGDEKMTGLPVYFGKVENRIGERYRMYVRGRYRGQIRGQDERVYSGAAICQRYFYAAKERRDFSPFGVKHHNLDIVH